MRIALEPILLIIPFLLTGVWVVLYRARSVDVHVYHHSEKNSPQQPAIKATRYIVVGQDRTDVLLDKIERDLIEINELIRR